MLKELQLIISAVALQMPADRRRIREGPPAVLIMSTPRSATMATKSTTSARPMAGWGWVRRAAAAVSTVFMGVAVIDCACQTVAGGVPRLGALEQGLDGLFNLHKSICSNGLK